MNASPYRPPGQLLFLAAFVAGPSAMFWLGSWGPTSALFLVLVSVAGVLLGLLVFCWRPVFSLNRVTKASGLAVLQAGLLWTGGWSGHALFESQVKQRLSEYRAIVDAELARLPAGRAGTIQKNEPHDDLAWAIATRFEDGGTRVQLAFRKAPRTLRLNYVSQHALPARDDRGRCLQEVAEHWYWYSRC